MLASRLNLAGISVNGKSSRAVGNYTPLSVLVLVALLLAVYATRFRNYRANLTIDTSWCLSFDCNYCMKDIGKDVPFGAHFPSGMDGTVVFGKLAALVQYAVLAPFDWSLVAANILSAGGAALSMGVIFVFLVGEGLSQLGAATCCPVLAATEPFVAMANPSSEFCRSKAKLTIESLLL